MRIATSTQDRESSDSKRGVGGVNEEDWSRGVWVQRRIRVNRFSAIDPVVLLHLRDDLRIVQRVRELNRASLARRASQS